MNNDLKQQLENLPPEILALPRFLRTHKNKPKAPVGEGWQLPENQKLYSELKGIRGFVAATAHKAKITPQGGKIYDF